MLYGFKSTNSKVVVFETDLSDEEVQNHFSDVCEAHGYSFEDKLAALGADAVIVTPLVDDVIIPLGGYHGNFH